jgi:adenylate kinase family enzyme
MLPDIILLDGPVGSGKGTQANLLSQNYGYYQFGFGTELRDFVSTYTNIPDHPNYQKATEIEGVLNRGDNVSPQDLFFVAGHKIEKLINENTKIVIDSAKNIEAFEWLASTSQKHNLKGLLIQMHLTLDISLERLSHRFYAPNLKDIPFNSYEDALKHCQEGQTPIRRSDDQNQDRIYRQYELYENNRAKIQKIMAGDGNFQFLEITAVDDIATIFDKIAIYLELSN